MLTQIISQKSEKSEFFVPAENAGPCKHYCVYMTYCLDLKGLLCEAFCELSIKSLFGLLRLNTKQNMSI